MQILSKIVIDNSLDVTIPNSFENFNVIALAHDDTDKKWGIHINQTASYKCSRFIFIAWRTELKIKLKLFYIWKNL